MIVSVGVCGSFPGTELPAERCSGCSFLSMFITGCPSAPEMPRDLSVCELCVLWSIPGFLRPLVAAAGSAGGSLANGVGLRSEQRLAPS